jgi:hypothetical protein
MGEIAREATFIFHSSVIPAKAGIQ